MLNVESIKYFKCKKNTFDQLFRRSNERCLLSKQRRYMAIAYAYSGYTNTINIMAYAWLWPMSPSMAIGYAA